MKLLPGRRERRGHRSTEEITWDEALDEIAAKFEAIKLNSVVAIGPNHFAGTMGWVMRDGLDRFRHAYGTSRQHSTICTTLPDSGWNAGHGVKHGNDPREIAESDLIIVWGGNPVSTQVNLMTHISRAKKDRNAKLVVVDVYETPTVKAADHAYLIRPGTDGALATALMHIMFRDGYADRAYMAEFADAPDELKRMCAINHPSGRLRLPACPSRRSKNWRRFTARRRVPSSASATVSRVRGTGRSTCMR